MEVESLHTITKKVLIIGLEKCSGNVKKKGFWVLRFTYLIVILVLFYWIKIIEVSIQPKTGYEEPDNLG